jgi:Rrf2 family nitric oxide-sensitive transcriptional repressor
MQLTQFTDYALRILLYLGHHPSGSVPGSIPSAGARLPAVLDIGRAYGISVNHLSKVAQRLGQLGFIVTSRGRSGGLQLGREPSQISIGELVRATEQFNLVECFDRAHNTCPIAPACGLKRALFEAQQQFLKALDRYTLADVLTRRQELVQLWGSKDHEARQAAAPGPSEIAAQPSPSQAPARSVRRPARQAAAPRGGPDRV